MNTMDLAAFLLVMVMITYGASGSPSPQTSSFCVGKNESSYCLNCMQPVYCDGQGGIIEYGICPNGEACAVSIGVSYCTTHTETQCACFEAGDQCDAYDPTALVHCLTSGPFLIDYCPHGQFCYDGNCRTPPACVPNTWSLLKPECTTAVFCDAAGSIIGVIQCGDGEYLNSDLDCDPAPPADCDGSCFGRCPNPIDCSKFVVCDGSTEVGSGDCPADTFFDTEISNCAATAENCIMTDGCVFREIITSTSIHPSTSTEQQISTSTPFPNGQNDIHSDE